MATDTYEQITPNARGRSTSVSVPAPIVALAAARSSFLAALDGFLTDSGVPLDVRRIEAAGCVSLAAQLITLRLSD